MKNLAILLALLFCLMPLRAAEKMNILFISVDDMNNDLGCYGNAQVKSPNLDKLAARGIKFDRAYCQFPLCSPSRTSIMTGLRPDATRVFDLQYHFRQEVPDVVTLSQFFKNNGYYAARVGKIYHYGNPGQIGTDGLDDPPSWIEKFNPAGRDKTVLEPEIIRLSRGGLGSSISVLADKEGRDEEHTDGMVASEAIRLMEANKGKPFFIAAGFYRPHCPYVAPQKYFDLYPLDKITLPPIIANQRDLVPQPALASTNPWPYIGVTPDEARQGKQAYYASISFVDAQIGRLIDALDRLGLRDNTTIVFWSDHGYLLGEHGLWQKQSCFEESARVPLIIAPPKSKSAGQSSPRTVELLDIYPTLVDLAGLTPPAHLQGASLRPLLENPQAQWNRPAYTQVQRGGFPGHSVRTERWRYTEWDGGEKGSELYDHENDPQELKNLADNPQLAEVQTQMKALIKANHPVRVQGGKVKKSVN